MLLLFETMTIIGQWQSDITEHNVKYNIFGGMLIHYVIGFSHGSIQTDIPCTNSDFYFVISFTDQCSSGVKGGLLLIFLNIVGSRDLS